MILSYRDKHPQIAAEAFIAPTATIIGDVTIEPGASVTNDIQSTHEIKIDKRIDRI